VPVQTTPALIVLIGPREAQSTARLVIAEWLGRAGTAVVWSAQESFRPDDLFERSLHFAGIRVWIDVSSSKQVSLYFRDPTTNRFVIRSLRLAHGLDEIGREEIGHIVASAVTALATSPDDALSESAARAALQIDHAQAAVVAATTSSETQPQPPLGLRLELAGIGGMQAYAHDMLVVEAVALSFALTRGPRWGRSRGSPGAWLDLGYQIPATYESQTVGARLSAVSLRAGLLWEMRDLRLVLFRVGLGGGVDRVHYRPIGDANVLDLAAAGDFWVPTASLWAGAEARLAEHVGLTVRAFADVVLAHVHYDMVAASGTAVQALTPYRIRPGFSMGAAFPF
jgi:hypothetical protein